MCVEVKRIGGEGFHPLSEEWRLAQRRRACGEGDRYAVLVVRRGKRSGVPEAMDLLVDPVALVGAGQLRQDVDGLQTACRAGASGPSTEASDGQT